jgi:hypothetical protein
VPIQQRTVYTVGCDRCGLTLHDPGQGLLHPVAWPWAPLVLRVQQPGTVTGDGVVLRGGGPERPAVFDGMSTAVAGAHAALWRVGLDEVICPRCDRGGPVPAEEAR